MNVTPDELRRVEIAQCISTAVFAGAFAALSALPFVDGGRLLLNIFGG